MKDLNAITENRLKTKSAFGYGIGSAIVANLCCLVPLIAITVGLSSFSFFLSFTKYRPYFLALSIILMAVTLWWNWQRNKECCQTKEQKEKLVNITIITILIYVVILSLLNYSLPNILANYQKTAVLKQNVETRLNLQVSGLTCPSCPEIIRKIVKEEKGVKEARFSYPSGKGYVIYDKTQINKAKIISVIKKAGYKNKP